MLVYILYRILRKWIDPFVKVINLKESSLSILSGQLTLVNIELNSQFLEIFGFLDFESITVGVLAVQIPLFNLLEQPLKLIISNVECTTKFKPHAREVTINPPTKPEPEASPQSTSVLSNLKHFFESFVVLITRLLMLVIQNFEIELHNIKLHMNIDKEKGVVHKELACGFGFHVELESLELKPGEPMEEQQIFQDESVMLQKRLLIRGFRISVEEDYIKKELPGVSSSSILGVDSQIGSSPLDLNHLSPAQYSMSTPFSPLSLSQFQTSLTGPYSYLRPQFIEEKHNRSGDILQLNDIHTSMRFDICEDNPLQWNQIDTALKFGPIRWKISRSRFANTPARASGSSISRIYDEYNARFLPQAPLSAV